MSDAQRDEPAQQSAAPLWWVRNKVDLDEPGSGIASGKEPAEALARAMGHVDFWISARRGDGVADLIAALVGFAENYFGSDEGGLIGRERQRKLLEQTVVSLRRCLTAIGVGEELAAEDLRMAAYSLGRLLGRVDVEDILDVIFRGFCIGK
jgi:tRNA modification GTPase